MANVAVSSEDLLAQFERMIHQNGNGYQQTRDDVAGLKSQVATVQRDLSNVVTAIERLAGRFEESRKPNYQIWTFGIGLVPVMFGGLVWLMTGQIANSIAPLSSELAQVKQVYQQQETELRSVLTQDITLQRDLSNVTNDLHVADNNIKTLQDDERMVSELARRSAQADENSRTDRTQLNERLHTLEARMSEATAQRTAQVAEISTRLLEIETQFKGQSNLNNQWRADQLRWDSILYEKAFPGSRFPNDTVYYPNMYSEHPAPVTGTNGK